MRVTAETFTQPKNQIVVAVDIDGVLYELVDVLRTWIHRVHGRPLESMPDPGVYDLEVAWELPPKFIFEQLVAGVKAGYVFWQGAPHRPGLDGLKVLKQAGYKVVLISARDLPGLEDLCLQATQTWLSRPEVNAVYDELILTSNKNDVHFDFLVDDYEKNVRAAHGAGRGAVLLDRGWNAGIELEQASWLAVPDVIENYLAQKAA